MNSNSWRFLTRICWVLLIFLATARFYFNPARNIAAYRDASHDWLQQNPLYQDSGHGFLYAPHAAILYIPFAILPELIGEPLWRAANILIFAWGIMSLACRIFPNERERFLVCLFSIPLSVGSALNGQFNLVMAGWMMLAVTNVADKNWWRATICITLAVAFKPLALVLALLMLPLFPQLFLRSLLALPIFALLPFLAQSPSYVAAQYAAFLQCLDVSAATGDIVPYAHFFTTLDVLGIDSTSAVRTTVRMIAAGLTFALCLQARMHRSRSEMAALIYSLAAAYITVFNPRTEGVTYGILGPVLGMVFAFHYARPCTLYRWAILTTTALMGSLMLANYELGKLLFPAAPSVLFSPLIGVLIYLGACIAASQKHQSPDGPGEGPVSFDAKISQEVQPL